MAEEESKGISLVILGIVAIVAIIGLVLLFRGGGVSGSKLTGAQSIQLCEQECNTHGGFNHFGGFLKRDFSCFAGFIPIRCTCNDGTVVLQCVPHPGASECNPSDPLCP